MRYTKVPLGQSSSGQFILVPGTTAADAEIIHRAGGKTRGWDELTVYVATDRIGGGGSDDFFYEIGSAGNFCVVQVDGSSQAIRVIDGLPIRGGEVFRCYSDAATDSIFVFGWVTQVREES